MKKPTLFLDRFLRRNDRVKEEKLCTDLEKINADPYFIEYTLELCDLNSVRVDFLKEMYQELCRSESRGLCKRNVQMTGNLYGN